MKEEKINSPTEFVTTNRQPDFVVDKDEWFVNDRNNFLESYPDVNCEELFNDRFFIGYATGKVGEESMAEIYASYMELCSEIERRTKDRAEQEFAVRLAKAKATPGSLTARNSRENSLFTLEELKAMTPKEIEQNWDKVQKSLKNLKKEK